MAATMCYPQMASWSAPGSLQRADRLLAAPNETKYGSPNYLSTSAMRIKSANRGSLEVHNPELQFVYFAKGLPASPGS